MADQNQTTAIAGHDELLRHAECYVRELLRIMGQPKDADDNAMVRRTASQFLRALYGRRLPL
jgi:hypothetical protein